MNVRRHEVSDKVAPFLHICLVLSYRMFFQTWKRPTALCLEMSQQLFKPADPYETWNMQMTQSYGETLPII